MVTIRIRSRVNGVLYQPFGYSSTAESQHFRYRPAARASLRELVRLCDRLFETKLTVVYDLVFRKPISVVYCLSLLQLYSL